MSALARNIKYFRTKNNLTQKDLSEILHKSESAVRMWELGKSQPDNDTLIKLSEIFKVQSDTLLGINITNPDNYNEQEISDFVFALADEVKDLSEEQKQAILRTVRELKNFVKNDK